MACNPRTVIIGAGLAGAAVAHFLDGPALVLEQGSQAGAEASAQNAGMVRLLVEDPVERRLALRGEARLRELGEEGSRVTGAVHGLVHDPGELDDAVAALRAAGHEVQSVDRAADVAPVLAGAALRRAWYVPGARVADPHALIQRLLAGAELRRGVQVRSLIVESGRLVGLQTSQGPLHAERVVLAAGAWAGALAATAGLHRPLFPVRRSLLLTTPHPLARPEHPWCWLEDLGLYLRPEAGRWLLSGCDERVEAAPQGPGSRGELDPDWRDQVGERLLATLPAIEEVGWSGGWTGLRTFAPDRRPLLGPDPELPGLFWAAGLGGFGLTAHLAVGEAVAAWLGGAPPAWLRSEEVDPGRTMPRRWVIRPLGTHHGSRLVSG